ncbi:MAG: DUF998 domain-containing protein [Anaerolineales bacterium]|nr:DUF998 domain-containing protein [Anaerolineales bacterium]
MSKNTSARLTIITSVGTLLTLLVLHILSPEFSPAWRMVSEYANGEYSWVLSSMFLLWALSSWALALTLWSEVKTTAGKVGLYFLILSGVGEAMAAAFDINHPLHELASFIGIGGLPVAALLISTSLGRTEAWSAAKKPLLWSAHLTWISIVLMAVTFALLISSFMQSGAEMPTDSRTVTTLPDGVIALVGWANRFLILAFCAWVTLTAWFARKVNS